MTSIGRPVGSFIPFFHPPAERWNEKKGMWEREPGLHLTPLTEPLTDTTPPFQMQQSGDKSSDNSGQQK
ncbi:hypothetical protein C4585_00085 [Candidatus Parcubacteria bacterium]|nr:MAG: hypothetical protein C4585_00085 [Candidatus Parcubacteria bacterium]